MLLPLDFIQRWNSVADLREGGGSWFLESPPFPFQYFLDNSLRISQTNYCISCKSQDFPRALPTGPVCIPCTLTGKSPPWNTTKTMGHVFFYCFLVYVGVDFTWNAPWPLDPNLELAPDLLEPYSAPDSPARKLRSFPKLFTTLSKNI